MVTQAAEPPGLCRELGRWDLTAIGVNQVIGAAIFAVPSTLAATTGAWSPWIVAGTGIASLLVALCFAEVGSRFEGTGGPYLYTRAAFGRFAAFEVGWMMWFTRTTSWAAVINVLVSSLGFYWPHLTSGWRRAMLISAIISVIAFINVRGIRQSSFVVNLLTIAKVLPLVIFVVAGLFAIDYSLLVPHDPVTVAGLSASGLALIFAFGGYEVVPVPAGEARDPRRAVPFALVTTLVAVTVIMTLVQLVALGTLPGLASSSTPLADSAARFLGASGGALLTIGAVFSTTGNNMGQALSGPRNLFALAEHGDLPAFFGRVHPRFRTPSNAIVVTAALALVLAVSGRFVPLALASALSRLLVYVFTCAATLRLRQPRFSAAVQNATFVVPFGPLVPVLAIAVSLAILAGASAGQIRAGLAAFVAGAVLYLIASYSSSRRSHVTS